MRIKWFDRLLIAVSSAALLLLGAFIILTAYQVPPLGEVGARLVNTLRVPGLTNGSQSWGWLVLLIMTIIGALLVVWGVRQIISIVPKKTRQSFFNAKQMENGSLSISLTALEHLVNRCLANHTEFANSHIRISGDEDKARVMIRSTITGGASMPVSTAALQKEICEHLSDYAGITVKSVDVIVEDTRLPGQLPPFEQKQLPDADARYAIPQQSSPSPYSILTGLTDKKSAPAQTTNADSVFGIQDLEEAEVVKEESTEPSEEIKDAQYAIVEAEEIDETYEAEETETEIETKIEFEDAEETMEEN